MINLAWTGELFWDGRAHSLEEQARGPIEASVEMALPMATALARVQQVGGYRDAFDRAFPRERVTEETLLKAIATFERTIVTGDTPFDRWMRGEADALDASARRGFFLFEGKAQCSQCHGGWNFTDNRFHDIGIATDDPGRTTISGDEAERHAFKTPGLREITERAPYMHNGSLPTLESVVAHYAGGGIPRETRSELMRPIALGADEQRDLVAFLRSLSSPQSRQSMPQLPAN